MSIQRGMDGGRGENRRLPIMPEDLASMSALQEQGEIHLRDYFYVLYRRRIIALAFLIITVISVFLAVYLKKPVYRATATLKIEHETPPVLNFPNAYENQNGDVNFQETQYAILKSRSVSKSAVRALNLEKDPEFAGVFGKQSASEEPGNLSRIELSGGGLDQDINPAIIDNFRSRITVTPVRDSWIVLVSFDDNNPALAARAANEVAKQYIGFNIESKLNASQAARDWLGNQLDDMKAKLERSDEALNNYAAKNGILLTGSGSAGADKNGNSAAGEGSNMATLELEQISDQLMQATSDRISKGALYYEYKSGGADSNPSVMNNPLLQQLMKDYSDLEAQYAKLSSVYTPEYPDAVQIKDQMNQLTKRINEETAKAGAALKADYEAALKRESDLAKTYDQLKENALNLNDKMVQYNILKREADTNQELYNDLLQRMKEVGISASLKASNNLLIVDSAEVPKVPFTPKKTRDMLVAVLVGLMGGVGLAFLVDYIDNTVKSPEDIEKAVSLPCLGMVPAIETVPAGKRLLVWEDQEEHAPALLEAYSSINTFIQFSSGSQSPKLMLVTSPLKGEGKTMTSVNLAATMARTKGKGIIIDSDLRAPQLHKIFDMDNSKGFSDYLAGLADAEDGLIRNTGLENLDIITSGPRSPNPPDLFNSPRLAELLRKLDREYEFILFDSPPILGFSDSLILSASMEGVVMVVRTGRTTREAALQSRRAIESVNSRVIGVVLNAIRQADLKYSSYYHYSDYYYYYADGQKKAGRKKNKKDAIQT